MADPESQKMWPLHIEVGEGAEISEVAAMATMGEDKTVRIDADSLRVRLNRWHAAHPDDAAYLYVPFDFGRPSSEQAAAKENLYFFGGRICVNTATSLVFFDERQIKMSKRAYAITAFLAQTPDQPRSRPEILKEVWGTDTACLGNVTVAVSRIRDYLCPEAIVARWGYGYYVPSTAELSTGQ